MFTSKNVIRACFAAVLAIGLAACGSSDEKSEAELEMERLAAAEAACTADQGRWNADHTCTEVDELIAEAAQMNCEAGGGRYESDGSCTSADALEMERLTGLEMACEDADGRWNADHTCTSAADLADEAEMERLAGLEMVCTDAGGRWNDDNTCTSVADLETERLAGLQTTCEDAGGRWNAGGADDPSCTSAADLETERLAGLQTTCEDAGGRWNAGGADDPSCTSAADLETERLAGLQTTCEDAGGRWNAGGADDPSCTSAADLETERLAGLQTTCEDAGGRWNAGGADDPSCTSAADLAMERAETQRTDINMKITAAQNAVGAVNDGADEATVTAANGAISAASMAVADAGDLDADEKAALNRAIALIQSNLTEKESSRQMAMEAEERAAYMAMAAMARKLHAGIGMNPLASSGDGQRTAVYSGTNDAEITVTWDNTDGTDITQMLKATAEMVDDNHGWDGKQYAASGTGIDGTYEAMVYSDVGAPTQGKKFGGPAADDEFQYPLVNGEYTIDTSTAAVQARVDSPRFDQPAGLKRFPVTPLSENQNQESRVTLPGTFHGVSGTYICTPGDAVCASRVAADGFELGTVPSATDTNFAGGSTTWKFVPANPNALVTDMEDTMYASYGWWIHTADKGDVTISAFHDEKGNVPNATGLDALNGKAKYEGGAAGKYALSSSTGGTNDAGHFTARAMLEANFTNNGDADAITGTIDMFMGADGEPRNWSVKLNGSAITEGGDIGDSTNGTAWSLDGTGMDSVASGHWTGTLLDNGDDGVPQVATGTFYSTFGSADSTEDGRMVGAFGVNKQ